MKRVSEAQRGEIIPIFQNKTKKKSETEIKETEDRFAVCLCRSNRDIGIKLRLFHSQLMLSCCTFPVKRSEYFFHRCMFVGQSQNKQD